MQVSGFLPHGSDQTYDLSTFTPRTPTSYLEEGDASGYPARFGVAESPPDTNEDGIVQTPAPRKRGRPKGPDKGPRKRRKKGTGQAGGWSRGMILGPRKVLDPGPEFNSLYAQATEAFVDEQDPKKAISLINEAIAINPEIYHAHALLAEISFSIGEDEKGVGALFTAAHASQTDAEAWFQAVSALTERSSMDRQSMLYQAAYCYSRIMHIGGARDRHNEARFQRAAINRELANFGKAMKDLETILETMPRNSSVLRQIAEICIETKNLARAKEIYEDTLAYYKENGFENEESFTWADVLVYGQILAHEEPPELAIPNSLKTLKQLSRWLQGRADETYWDEFNDDDREFDSEHDPRRVLVSEFVAGRHSLESYGVGIPIEIRVRLGMLRLSQGEEALEEALAHFEWLEPDARGEGATIDEYPDLFLEVAQALYEIKEYDQALRYFRALRETNAYAHTTFWVNMAASLDMCGEEMQALECYEEAKLVDDKCVEARTRLSKLYLDFGDKELAIETAREAVRVAESLLPDTGKRKYEPRELRNTREEAEKILADALRLPGDYTGGVPLERLESTMIVSKRGFTRKRFPTQVAATRRSARQGDEGGQPGDDMEIDSELPLNDEAKMARRIVRELIQKRNERGPPRFDAPPPKYDYRVQRPSAKERDARRTDTINALYQSLLDNTDSMRESDELARDEWMKCAEKLLKDFQCNRSFYADDRIQKLSGIAREELRTSRKKWQQNQEGDQVEDQDVDPDTPLQSVESTTPTEYREIEFSEWLDIFLEYALLLSQSSDEDAQHRCYTIIEAALGCIVWKRDPQILLQIYITYLTCTLALKDDETLYNTVLRWFMKTYEFNNDAYRLVAAVNLLYLYPPDKKGKEGQMLNAKFRGRATYQFILKSVMQADSSLPADYSPPEFGPVPEFMRRAGGDKGRDLRSKDDVLDEDDLEETPGIRTTGDTPVPADEAPAAFDETPVSANGNVAATHQPPHATDQNPATTGPTLAERADSEPSQAADHNQSPPPKEQHQIPPTEPPPTADPDLPQPSEDELTLKSPLPTPKPNYSQPPRSTPTTLADLPFHLLLLYGQLLSSAGTHTGALSCFLRAQSLNPHDPVILFSIALSYMHHVLIKKCDNRHMMLLQGWAFFEEYVDERRAWAHEKGKGHGDGEVEKRLVEREVAFNRARCWHMLGMADLAIRGYQEVLALPAPDPPDTDLLAEISGFNETGEKASTIVHSDFGMDAAYAMSTIYALSGNTQMAREVAEKYLVV